MSFWQKLFGTKPKTETREPAIAGIKIKPSMTNVEMHQSFTRITGYWLGWW